MKSPSSNLRERLFLAGLGPAAILVGLLIAFIAWGPSESRSGTDGSPTTATSIAPTTSPVVVEAVDPVTNLMGDTVSNGIMLDGVHGGVSWELDLSPDGLHEVLQRTTTTDGRRTSRVEIDGRADQDYPHLDPIGYWSPDSSGYAYTYGNKRFLVYRGTTFGPYHTLAKIVISPDGAHWAAFDVKTNPRSMMRSSEAPAAPDPPVLFVDGKPIVLPAGEELRAGSLLYTSQGALIFEIGTDPHMHWITSGGASVSPPVITRLPPPPPALPPGVKVSTKRVRSEIKDGQRPIGICELTVNGVPVGEFEAVFTWNQNGRSFLQIGAPEPDGTICIFAARDQTLYRIRVRPSRAR